MKKFLLVCMALLGLLGVQAAPVMPTVSTATSYTYYTVSFARQSTKCLQDNGIDANITQVALPSPISAATAAQEWRIEPTAVGATTYNLVSKLGNRLFYNGSKCVTRVVGHTYSFVATTNPSYTDKWELARVGGLVTNDQGGSTVCEYYANDGGNPLIFTLVESVAPTAKEILISQINIANAFKAGLVIGTNPGQYKQVDADNLQIKIDAAIVLRDKTTPAPATDTEMLTSVADLKATVAAISPNLIKVSTTGNDTWYYIVSTSNDAARTDSVMMDNATGSYKINWGRNDAKINKYWRFIASTNGTYKIQNRASEMYIGVSNSWSNVSLSAGGNNYSVTYLGQGQLNIFEAGKTPLHAAAAGKEVVSWEGGLNSASSWKLVEAPALTVTVNYAPLKLFIITAKAMNAANYPIGTTLGTFPQAKWDALQTAITTADQFVALGETGTQTDVDAQKTALLNAIVDLNASCVTPKISTLYSSTWYTLKAPRPTDTYMTSGGTGANTTSSTLVIPTSDTQLWKVVTNGSGIALVNKATGEYANADTGDNTRLATKATAPTNTLRFIPSTDIVNGAVKFWLENTVGSSSVFRLHAGGTYPMNWTGNAGDNCTWQLTEISTTALGASDFNTAVAAARALYNNTVGGTEYTEFPIAARTAFNSAIANEEAKTAASLTPEQVYNAIEGLKAATAAYTATVNVTASDAVAYKWYTMESAKFPGKYLTIDPSTKAMSAAIKDNSDNQLFRFVKKPNYDRVSGGKTTNFVNLHEITSKSVEGTIRCENANWDIVYNTGTGFPASNSTALGYWPWEMTLKFGANGTQTLLESLDWDGVAVKADGVLIENNLVNAYNGENAWKIVFVKQETPNAFTSNSISTVKVTTVNRMLVITGTTQKAKAFTVTGAQVDATKSLNPGIYIVKVAGNTVKVNVQ